MKIEINFLKPDQIEFIVNAIIGFFALAIITQIVGNYVTIIKGLGIAMNIFILIILVMLRSRVIKWKTESEKKQKKRKHR